MKQLEDEPAYLTVPEIAARQRVSRTFVKRALHAGLLRGHQLGAQGRWRVTEDDYRAWVAAGAPTMEETDKEKEERRAG